MIAKRNGVPLGFLVFLTLAQACSIYDESLVRTESSQGDASTNTCPKATWPTKPSGVDLGGGNDFVVALAAFDFGESYKPPDDETAPEVPARDVGYDLDNKCTRNPDKPDPLMTDGNSCRPIATWYTPVHPDYKGGIDNNLSYLIHDIAAFLRGFGTPIYNFNIQRGDVSLLMQITDYNGEPNDDSIGFIIYTPGAFSDQGNVGEPKFDGTDVWAITEDSYDANNQPRYVATSAYVTNGTMVATLPNADLRLRIGMSYLELTTLNIRFLDPFFTAEIKKDGSGLWVLENGRIAARWRTQDLFSQLKYFPNPFPTEGSPANMCLTTPTYPFVRDRVCMYTDIYSGSTTPDPVCDAISLGIGFRAVQANLGKKIPPLELATSCPEGADPIVDSCDKIWGDGGL